MRKIEFRGKRLDNGNWVCGDLINEPWGLVIQYYEVRMPKGAGAPEAKPTKRRVKATVDPSSVGQFSGLLDKNDVKVFEGDIVQFYRYSDMTSKHEKTDMSPVRFFRGAYMYDTKYVSERTLSSLWRPGESMEVIGNVYDSPELTATAELGG